MESNARQVRARTVRLLLPLSRVNVIKATPRLATMASNATIIRSWIIMGTSIVSRSVSAFRPALAQSVAAAALFPLLIGLGVWQWHRAQEKEELFAAIDEALHAEVQPVTSLGTSNLPQHARAAGHYDRFSFLLDNRVHDGRIGYEVLAPLLLTNGHAVLIDRGWLPQGPDRAHLPVVSLPSSPVQINGLALTPSPPPFALTTRELFSAGWPKVVQTAVPAQLATVLGYPLLPVVIYPDGSEAAAHEVAALQSFTPSRHRAYAAQWFAMSVVLLAVYLRHGFRRRLER
jgi:cytochrome oxidase assembly protein ShyY1